MKFQLITIAEGENFSPRYKPSFYKFIRFVPLIKFLNFVSKDYAGSPKLKSSMKPKRRESKIAVTLKVLNL
jgi:hypothetical protein